MSYGEKNLVRWLETTSASVHGRQSEVDAFKKNNIPSFMQEESHGLPRRATRLATPTSVVATRRTIKSSRATEENAAGNLATGKNSCSDTAPTVKRVVANRGKIKTQIAKISYSHRDDKTTSSPPKTVRPTTTMVQRIHLDNASPQSSASKTLQYLDYVISDVDEYAATKKKEREEEMSQLKEMLEDMTIAPPEFKEFTEDLISLPKAKKGSKDKSENAEKESSRSEKETPLSKKESPGLLRSKSDMNSRHTKASTERRRNTERGAATTARSKSSQPATMKSYDVRSEVSPERRVTYDRAETRRFMEEQRKKRRLQEAISTQRSQLQSAKEKERIKQRLEELRKYSRKIVCKNIKNSQKRASGVSLIKKPPVVFTADDKTAMLNKDTIINVIESDRTPKSAKKSDRKLDKNGEMTNEDKINTIPGALTENKKRVGILRKSEFKDHSFSAIKAFCLDKENQALNILAPKYKSPYGASVKDCKLVAPPPSPVVSHELVKDQEESQEKAADVREEKEEPSQEQTEVQDDREVARKSNVAEKKDINKQEKTYDKEEEPPIVEGAESSHRSTSTYDVEAADSSRCSLHEQAVQVNDPPSLKGVIVEETIPNERSELPFWLKPSAVQVYPFNFIMAVRRKLEAIVHTPTQPQITDSNKPSDGGELKSNKIEEAQISSFPNDHVDILQNQNNAKLRLITTVIEETNSITHHHNEVFATHTIEEEGKFVEKPFKRKSSEAKQKSQTVTDINSHSSSVSSHVAASNTASRESSIRSGINICKPKTSRIRRKADDDTTISSSIFNSPKRQAQEDVYNKDGFKIPQRALSPLSVERIEHLKISSKKKHAQLHRNRTANYSEHESSPHDHSDHRSKNVTKIEVDFNSLLQDFNRSLSQVIEVNQQLKTTIHKSHQIFSPQLREEYKDDDDYSSVFESCSSVHDAVATETIHKSSSNSSRRTYNIQTCSKDVFQVNSVQPHTQSGSDNENNGFELDINLDSIEISSTTHTEAAASAHDDGDVHSRSSIDDNLQKRLKAIEDLKENLKRDILKSKASRRKDRNDIENERKKKEEKSSMPMKDKGDLVKRQENIKEEAENIKTETRNKSEPSYAKIKSALTKNLEFVKKLSTNMENLDPSINSVSEENSSPSYRLSPGNTMVISAPSSAKQMNAIDSSATKTFTIENRSENSQTPTTRKSSNFNAQSIEEELHQDTVEIFSRHSNNATAILSSQTKSSSPSSSIKSEKHTTEAFIKSHINPSRGDFLSEANENHFRGGGGGDCRSVASLKVDHIEKGSTAQAPNANNQQSKKMSQIALLKKAAAQPFAMTGQEYVTVYNQSDVEVSIISSGNCSLSEKSLNYSNVGLYEKLIQSETCKSEQLAALLKMREKALIDRTRGQIAWLEVQKERYKARGLPVEIAAIKKKQRGILMKMEKEREEIKRLLQSNSSTGSSARLQRHHAADQQQITPLKRHRGGELRKTPPVLPPLPLVPKSGRISGATYEQQQRYPNKYQHSSSSAASTVTNIVRANYDLESSHILEELLQKRELDLRRRRQHVERLMLWHQRLDQEEAEVQQLECMLIKYNKLSSAHAADLKADSSTPSPQKQQNVVAADNGNQPQTERSDQTSSPPTATKTSSHEKQRRGHTHESKMERRLRDIERSLRELSTISIAKNSAGSSASAQSSTASTASAATNSDSDYVRTSGSKLNKLWRRLTAQQVERFDSTRRYKLCKADLEQLYEEAKVVVLREFSQNEERIAVDLLDKTTASTPSQSSATQSQTTESNRNAITIPRLNLNFSSEQSSAEEEAPMEYAEEEEEDKATRCELSAEASPALPISGGTYSPSAAEEEDYIDEEPESNEGSVSPASSSHSSLNYDSNARTATPPSGPQRVRSELLERNVQKFMELAQRFSSTQQGNTLERSLSDTQIAESSSGVCKKSGKNTATFAQRNIAYYGVKTQKRPSMLVNVEIANSLNSASSILSAANLRASSTASNSNIPLDTRDENPPSNNSTATLPRTTTKSTSNTSIVDSDIPSISATPSEIGKISLPDCLRPPLGDQASRQLEESIETAPSAQTVQHAAGGSTSYSYTFEDDDCERSLSAVEEIDDCQDDSSTIKTASCNSSATMLPQRVVASTTAPSNSVSLGNYEQDYFENAVDDGDETRLEDVSFPQFDATLETTQNDDVTDEEKNASVVKETVTPTPLQTSNDTLLQSLSCSESLPPPPKPLPPPPPPPPTFQVPSTSKDAAAAANSNSTAQQQLQEQQLMPDIINEVELRRCQQQPQQQQSQYEHVTAVPYNMYVREIPNKPPPPYVPPAHGSPMTTIFPSEERIKDLTYRRTHELYCEISKTEYTNEKGEKLPSVLTEKITNIYERIILDICREYLDDHHEALAQADPAAFHSKLAFFNPPDRLSCLQKFVYQEVRRCLAMDKKQPKRTPVYSVYGQRAKRDHIGQIIIQEMYDEDDKWCNFHREESEVLDLIVDEMVKNMTRDTAKQVLLEEGGQVEEDDTDAQAEQADEAGGGSDDGCDVTTQNTDPSEPPSHVQTNTSSSLMSDGGDAAVESESVILTAKPS